MRHERSLTERLGRVSLQLAEEEQDHARLAVVAERARLARDLHGFVARQVSAMVVQAQLAERLLGFDQCRLDETIGAIEETGRTALRQMRTTLGVLRAGGEARQLSPQPGIGLAHDLIRQSRDDGQDVHLKVLGTPFPLPAAIDLIAYRILEEALTGHRPLGQIDVSLRFCAESIGIEVQSSDRHPWPTSSIRERVAMCDGHLDVTHPEAPSQRTRLVALLPLAFEGAVA